MTNSKNEEFLVQLVFNFVLLSFVGYFIYDNYVDLVHLDIILSHLLVFTLIISYYNFIFHKWLFTKINKDKELKEQLRREEQQIIKFLDFDLDYPEMTELKGFIEKYEKCSLLKYSSQRYGEKISKKLNESKKRLNKLIYQEGILQLERKKDALELKINELESQKYQEKLSEEEKKEKIRSNLDLDNTVFLKSDLNTEEIEILKEEGYRQVNEFDLNESRVITVLVKPILNHSPSHVFLVWSIIQLLEERFSVEKIEEHYTKDADITFRYKNRYYALEIETGTLLKKKRQAIEKVEFLNMKYGNRWMFIVSNKNLLPKYKKLGLSTQRQRVEESLKKMLRIDTQ